MQGAASLARRNLAPLFVAKPLRGGVPRPHSFGGRSSTKRSLASARMAPGSELRSRFCTTTKAASKPEDQEGRPASSPHTTSTFNDMVSVLPGFSLPSANCAVSCPKQDVHRESAEVGSQEAAHSHDQAGPRLKPRSSIPPGLAWADPLRFGPLSQPSQEDLDKAAAFAEGTRLYCGCDLP